MTKYELLRWLDDPDLKEKIRQIVAEPEKISSPKLDESLSKLETENRRLKETLRAAELEKNSAKILREKYLSERAALVEKYFR